jgi:hypothetical protein
MTILGWKTGEHLQIVCFLLLADVSQETLLPTTKNITYLNVKYLGIRDYAFYYTIMCQLL